MRLQQHKSYKLGKMHFGKIPDLELLRQKIPKWAQNEVFPVLWLTEAQYVSNFYYDNTAALSLDTIP